MAAAFAALLSLKNNLDLIQNHPRHSFSFEAEQIQSLHETVSYLIDFLKRFDYSPGIHKEAAEALERRIARAAEAAEDVVESHVVEQVRSGKTRGSKTGSSRFLLDLQKVTLDLDYMRRKAINIKVQSGVEAEQPPTYSSTSAKDSTTTMVGFDEVLLQLLDKLTGVPSSRQVIPIVGMGGIGKTFLARNAFQHPLTVEHFDICLWATISQQYTVEKILTQLVSGLRKFKSKIFDEPTSYRNADEKLEDELHKGLYGRRYLIVLDDMWSVQAWEDVMFSFPETGNGSRILVTTRLSNVANHFSIVWHPMHFLDEINSWDLFCQKTFAEKGCPTELEEIGKKIVEKCNGLPLAIVVVGGHLSHSSMALEYWVNVANHMYSVLNSAEGEEQCMNVLSLSYSYLPPHLKPCFLLLGAFPEDEDIYGRDVGKLWISEGLIEPTENAVLETVAEDYLLDLYERNLLLVDGLGYNGKIVKFKLHDLLREMCIKIGQREEFLIVLDSKGAISRERRVVISGEEIAGVLNNTKTLDAPIRCLMYEGDWPSCDLKLLRTLNTVVPTTTGVPISQQVNLRFLKVDLDRTALHTFYLPSSISLLWNLQILKIYLEASLVKVIFTPYEIWEMLQLRHLEIFPICLVDPLPVERLDERNDDSVMKNLQTLKRVDNFVLSEEVCKRIPNVRELQLRYLDGASSDTYNYCPHNLCYFHRLEFCTCDFYGGGNWRDYALSLTFPTSLKWLYLGGCGVDWDEMTAMVGSLPYLISLRLSSNAVIGSVWTTVEDKFPGLKCLEIWDCDELVHLNVESSHFPVLKKLHLRRLPNLGELPSEIGEITTLTGIKMEECSESSSISAIRILVEQEEQGNSDLQVLVTLHGDEEALESFIDQVCEENLTSKNLFLDLKIQ